MSRPVPRKPMFPVWLVGDNNHDDMTVRNNTPRRYNQVEICVNCGAIAGATAAECAHERTAKVELTPSVKRSLTQLRGARSYLRYLTERFGEMVQIEQLAHAQAAEANDTGSRRSRKPAVANNEAEIAPVVEARQVSLFG